MHANILSMTQDLDKNLEVQKNLDLTREQNKLLESTLAEATNRGLNIGIRTLLPHSLSNKVMEVTDALMQEGLHSAIRTAVNQTIEMGRNALNFVRDGFRNIFEVRTAFGRGDLANNISNNIDDFLEKANQNGRLDQNICKCIDERQRNNHYYGSSSIKFNF